MSDTKLQVKNINNKYYISSIKELYKRSESLIQEIRRFEEFKEEEIYIYIHRYVKLLKNHLKENQELIKETRSQIIIC